VNGRVAARLAQFESNALPKALASRLRGSNDGGKTR
jgi:hypothetical protein